MHIKVHYGTLEVARWVTWPHMLDDKELYPTAYICQPSHPKARREWTQDNWLEIQVLSGQSSWRSRRGAQHVNATVLLSSVLVKWPLFI